MCLDFLVTIHRIRFANIHSFLALKWVLFCFLIFLVRFHRR